MKSKRNTADVAEFASLQKILLEKVEKTEQCEQALTACRSAPSFRHQAASCAQKFEQYCVGTKFWNQGTPVKTSVLQATLVHNQKTLPYGPLTDGELASEFAEKQNLCEKNLLWGYYREGGGRELHGSFSTQMECDEARLNDDKKGGWHGDVCRQRYVGDPQVADVIQADIMYKESRESYEHNSRENWRHFGIEPSAEDDQLFETNRAVLKHTIKFGSFAQCMDAVKTGFQYHLPTGEILNIGPLAEKKPPKVIKACYENQIVVCEPGKFDINNVEFYNPAK